MKTPNEVKKKMAGTKVLKSTTEALKIKIATA